MRQLRLVYAAFLVSPIWLALAAAIVQLQGPRTPSLPMALQVALSVAAAGSLGLVRWARTRPLDPSSSERLAGSFRASFMLALAFAESPSVLGVLAALLGGQIWFILGGAALSLAALATVAPGRLVQRRQLELLSMGSPMLLEQALEAAGLPREPGATH